MRIFLPWRMTSLFSKRPDTFDATAARVCLSCGNSFTGRYCNQCGEKVVEPNERTLRYFFGHVINAFTFLDGKFWRSFRTMLTRPGQMSRDICDGKRQPYMRPVSFFFVANVIYFLFPLFQTFNTRLHAQMDYMFYSEALHIKEKEERKSQALGLTPDEFVLRYNAHTESASKLALIALPVFFSLFIVILFIRKKLLYLDHLTFSIEFIAFFVFIPTIILSLLLWIVQAGVHLISQSSNLYNDDLLGLISLILAGVFLFLATRNFFGITKIMIRSLATLTMLLVSVITVVLYRLLLFYLTMATL